MEFKLGPHETLIMPSEDWVFDDLNESKSIATAMIDFMVKEKGIGLAANQVGINKKVFVMGSHNIDGFPKPFAVFNPKILQVSEDTSLYDEGCLSYPGLFLKVKRPQAVIVEYQDEEGIVHTSEMNGLIARCFQHEFDHLNGICFVDRVSQMKLQLAMKKLRKK